MTAFRSLYSLRPANWLLMANAYRWLFRARRKMRQMPARQLLNWDDGIAETAAPVSPEDARLIRRRARFVNLAARFPYPWALCLQRSVALRDWLARDSLFSQLRIGVRKCDGSLQAHAWVEYRGVVVNDHPSVTAQFVPFALDGNRAAGEALGSILEWTR